MRGQMQASVRGLPDAPARERAGVWVDARVRQRKADRSREVEVRAALAGQRRAELRASAARPAASLRRLPY